MTAHEDGVLDDRQIQCLALSKATNTMVARRFVKPASRTWDHIWASGDDVGSDQEDENQFGKKYRAAGRTQRQTKLNSRRNFMVSLKEKTEGEVRAGPHGVGEREGEGAHSGVQTAHRNDRIGHQRSND